MQLRLFLTGRPEIVLGDNTRIVGVPDKAFALAALLAVGPRSGIVRSELADILWPGLTEQQRATNLRQLLFRTRKLERAAGTQLFIEVEKKLQLPGAHFWCDIWEIERTTTFENASQLTTFVDRYRGPLLEGIAISGDRLNHRIDYERGRLREVVISTIMRAAEWLDPAAQLPMLLRAIELVPQDQTERRAEIDRLISLKKSASATIDIFGRSSASNFALPRDATPAQFGRDLAGVPRVALLVTDGLVASGREFVGALVDDVAIALTRLRSISVVAPYSAKRLVLLAGKNLHASNIDFVAMIRPSTIPGSLSVMLERCATGDILWGETFSLDRDAGPEGFAILANGISKTLVTNIERATLATFESRIAPNAYEQYLYAQSALQSMDLPSVRRSRNMMRRALEQSQYFAPAHSGLAQSYIYEWVLRGRANADLIKKARLCAETAMSIDPLDGSASRMLGRASLFIGDFDTSLEHFAQAEALAPHHSDMLCDYADTLMHSSRPAEANQKIELALRLNPVAPDAYWWASAGIKFFIGQYDEALRHLGNVENEEPSLRLAAACAAMAGRPEQAKVAHDKFMMLDPGFKIDHWISALPVREPEHREHYRNALALAGFT